MTPFTPSSAHSRMTSGTVVDGVTMTARSTGSGSARRDGQALMPSTFGRLGLMG